MGDVIRCPPMMSKFPLPHTASAPCLYSSTMDSPSSSSSRSKAIAVAAVVATGVLAYAVYFDYKRRNDVEFRRKLSELAPHFTQNYADIS